MSSNNGYQFPWGLSATVFFFTRQQMAFICLHEGNSSDEYNGAVGFERAELSTQLLVKDIHI